MTIATRASWVGTVLATMTAVVLAAHLAAWGQKTVAKTGPEDQKGLVERWAREVAQYAVETHTEPAAALALKSEPAFRWTNPERETDGGLVFLWLGRGRPEAKPYCVRWDVGPKR
jgi:hypothetical protein